MPQHIEKAFYCFPQAVEKATIRKAGCNEGLQALHFLLSAFLPRSFVLQ